MKKIILLSVIIIGCLMLTVIFPVHPTLAADKAELMPMELDGTEWVVEFVSKNKKGEKVIEKDTLMFKEEKFISKIYDKKGYDPTNYSLTVSEDDVTGYGTMQIKDKETSFWKGEVRGEEIIGSLHVQYPSGDNKTRYYTGTLLDGELKRKTEPKSVVQKPVQPPASRPAVKEEPPVQPMVEDVKKEAVVE